MTIRDEYEYQDADERLEILEAKWNSYYIDYERGNIEYYEYNIIMSKLEEEMYELERAMNEWESLRK